MARVDFFLRGEDELCVNEINTIPGFTDLDVPEALGGERARPTANWSSG